MKRKIGVWIAVCLCLVLVLAMPAFARAGGAGGGGGYRGGGGYGGGYHSYYRPYGYGMMAPMLLGPRLWGGLGIAAGAVVVAGGAAAVFVPFFSLLYRKNNLKKQIQAQAAEDPLWDYDTLVLRAKETFFAVQQCWTQRDMAIGEPYLSRQRAGLFAVDLAGMRERGERNVLEQIRLKRMLPWKMQAASSSGPAAVWFLVQASMVDYTVAEMTGQVVSGSSHPQSFTEYWLFIQEDGRWVLDDIRQKKDKHQLPFPVYTGNLSQR